MKVYIPFNMIVDTDFGVIRFVEDVNRLSEYPVNKLKSFLINRKNENPIPEYCELRNAYEMPSYNLLMETEKYYNAILKLSKVTDIMSLVINTHKLGLASEMDIIIGCNTETEIQHLKDILSKLKYGIKMDLNSNIKLNDFDYIFTKCLDEYYVDYLINNGINRKRLYVADYKFNTIIDPESKKVGINPELHMALESEGIIVSTITVYNKK